VSPADGHAASSKANDAPPPATDNGPSGLGARILVGMAVGSLLGALAAPRVDWLVPYLAEPLGTIFLRLLLLMVMPLAAVALVLGILGLEGGHLGGLARRAAGLTIGLTSSAVAIGITCVHLLQPGRGVERASLPGAGSVSATPAGGVDAVLSVFPKNLVAAAAEGNLVAVLVAAVLFGLALRATDTPGTRVLRGSLEGLFDTCAAAVRLVLHLAPIGIGALFCTLVARTGLEGLVPLARFVGVTLLAIGLQMFVVYPLVLRFAGGWSPLAFFRGARPAMALAFSTASSAATLPTTLRTAEEGLGLQPETARFVLTVGASANQNGTALFEGVAVLFLAQLYGVELSIAQQAALVGVSLLAGIGTAGVPGGSLPVIAAIAVSLGIPAESVGVLAGVDRLLDMCRTTLNVVGDLVIAAVLGGPRSKVPA
jgi:DAACS family dicarboxylate/amino acid:cation (Na+ or H+) symporter